LLFSSAAECIYHKSWLPANLAANGGDGSEPVSAVKARGTANNANSAAATARNNKASDDAKLIFGTIFSLRNMVRKLGGDDDALISFRTGQYKVHYYETPTNLRFVLMTDTATMSMRNVLHQIYINLWVEYGMHQTRNLRAG